MITCPIEMTIWIHLGADTIFRCTQKTMPWPWLYILHDHKYIYIYIIYIVVSNILITYLAPSSFPRHSPIDPKHFDCPDVVVQIQVGAPITGSSKKN